METAHLPNFLSSRGDMNLLTNMVLKRRILLVKRKIFRFFNLVKRCVKSLPTFLLSPTNCAENVRDNVCRGQIRFRISEKCLMRFKYIYVHMYMSDVPQKL